MFQKNMCLISTISNMCGKKKGETWSIDSLATWKLSHWAWCLQSAEIVHVKPSGFQPAMCHKKCHTDPGSMPLYKPFIRGSTPNYRANSNRDTETCQMANSCRQLLHRERRQRIFCRLRCEEAATASQHLRNGGCNPCYEYLWFLQLAATSIDHWSALLQLHLAGDLKSSLAAPNMAPGNLAPQLHPFGSENSLTTTGQGVGHWSSGPQRTRTATDVCWCIVDVLKCSETESKIIRNHQSTHKNIHCWPMLDKFG